MQVGSESRRKLRLRGRMLRISSLRCLAMAMLYVLQDLIFTIVFTTACVGGMCVAES